MTKKHLGGGGAWVPRPINVSQATQTFLGTGQLVRPSETCRSPG